MELQGVINHALKSLCAKKISLKLESKICENDIEWWDKLNSLHSNKSIIDAINGITNVRHLFSSSDYMKEFIRNDENNSFNFMGFSLDLIQFYINLRMEIEK